MAYALYDFTESLDRVGIDPATIETVLAAYGDQGDCAEWHGGFVMKMRDGRIAVLTGWCDTTGWGCQDGADLSYPESAPTIEPGWDESPADLNKWLVDGEHNA